jgi:hypothetical protein
MARARGTTGEGKGGPRDVADDAKDANMHIRKKCNGISTTEALRGDVAALVEEEQQPGASAAVKCGEGAVSVKREKEGDDAIVPDGSPPKQKRAVPAAGPSSTLAPAPDGTKDKSRRLSTELRLGTQAVVSVLSQATAAIQALVAEYAAGRAERKHPIPVVAPVVAQVHPSAAGESSSPTPAPAVPAPISPQ